MKELLQCFSKLNSWIDLNFKGLINNPAFVFHCHVRKTLINLKKWNPFWIMLMQASEEGDLILTINYGDWKYL